MKISRILIVDDDRSLLPTLQAIIMRLGYGVLTASSRNRGIEVFRTERPDLVMTDLSMEHDIAGFDLVREIRREPNAENVPIIMMSSDFPPDLKEAAQKLGVIHFLEKPFEATALKRAIEYYTTTEA